VDFSEDQRDRVTAGEAWVPPLGAPYWRQDGELIIYGSTPLAEAIERTKKYIEDLELSLRANPKFMAENPQIAERTRARLAGSIRAIAFYKRRAADGLLFVNMPNDWTAEMFDEYLKARTG
jgi:hypothetical protein